MTSAQKKLLRALINKYLGNMAEPHRRVRMEEIDKYLDRTYFSWVGDAQPPQIFYYRIHSPVVLIEFDHQAPVASSLDRAPTRNHLHTVVRTPNGNDYGKDSLRQHYAHQKLVTKRNRISTYCGRVLSPLFPPAKVQCCLVHAIRSSVNHVRWKERKTVAADLKPIDQAATEPQARLQLGAFASKWSSKYSSIVNLWNSNWETLAPGRRPGNPAGSLRSALTAAVACLGI